MLRAGGMPPARTLAAVEAERRRLAGDLHDTAAQALAMVRLSLERARRHGGSAEDVAAESLPLIDAAIVQVRDLIFGLRPPMLEELGLVAAVRWSLAHLARGTGLTTEIVADPCLGALSPEVATACCRIAHEAIANAVRHAEAGRITVRLECRRGWLRLEVTDDGRGLGSRDDATDPRPTYGMAGMRERALAAGGNLRVGPSRGGGTRVVATLPFPEQDGR